MEVVETCRNVGIIFGVKFILISVLQIDDLTVFLSYMCMCNNSLYILH